ncbi:MAG: 50S ribosomal protein L18 [bacterium]|nr:50S ribosomal protein L18 [bacterium]
MSYIKGKLNKKTLGRVRRHARIRARLSGTAQIPRLAVFKSNRYIYAQLIDDVKGSTIGSATTLKETKGTMMEKAEKVGEKIAKVAEDMKIKEVVFDRGGFRYMGHVKALADSARKGGLKF